MHIPDSCAGTNENIKGNPKLKQPKIKAGIRKYKYAFLRRTPSLN
jgi:hypothetical protein